MSRRCAPGCRGLRLDLRHRKVDEIGGQLRKEPLRSCSCNESGWAALRPTRRRSRRSDGSILRSANGKPDLPRSLHAHCLETLVAPCLHSLRAVGRQCEWSGHNQAAGEDPAGFRRRLQQPCGLKAGRAARSSICFTTLCRVRPAIARLIVAIANPAIRAAPCYSRRLPQRKKFVKDRSSPLMASEAVVVRTSATRAIASI